MSIRLPTELTVLMHGTVVGTPRPRSANASRNSLTTTGRAGPSGGVARRPAAVEGVHTDVSRRRAS